MHRYTEKDFTELATRMVDGTGLRLTFDAGQQLNAAIIALFHHKICTVSKDDLWRVDVAVSGVMGLPMEVTFIPEEHFDVTRFSTIMAGLRASIVKASFVRVEDLPTPVRTDAFSTPSVYRSTFPCRG